MLMVALVQSNWNQLLAELEQWKEPFILLWYARRYLKESSFQTLATTLHSWFLSELCTVVHHRETIYEEYWIQQYRDRCYGSRILCSNARRRDPIWHFSR